MNNDPNGRLPEPESDELNALVTNKVTRRHYRELYDVTPAGLDINELKARIPEYAGQMHFDRRLRDLDKVFVLARERTGGRLVYRLAGRREQVADQGRISQKLRAEILYRDGSRCQMCGKSPQRDPDVELQVDHKVPLNWGGRTSADNLWVLCQPCNKGKRDYFSSADQYAEEIRAAVHHPEVHRRMGELFRAFRGEEVPSYLLEIVASAQQFQEDWQRRLRELKELGWDYEVRKQKEAGRIRSYYRLTKDGGWPLEGTIRQALNRAKRAKGNGAKPLAA